MAKRFFVFLWLSSCPAWTKVLTLQEAINIGLEQSPVINSAKREQTIAEAELRSNLARFFPSLDLTSSHGLARTSPNAGATDPWTSEFKLALSETLYDNGVNINRYRFNDLRRSKTELEFKRARDQFILDSCVLYYKFQIQQYIKGVRLKQHQRIMGEYKLAEKQYRQGMKSRRDFLRFFSQIQRSEVELEESEKSIENLNHDLQALINLPAAEFTAETEELKPITTPDKELKYTDTVTSKISELAQKTGELDTNLVERRWWPEIILKSEVFYRNGNYLNTDLPFENGHSQGWNALVVLNFNLWDWGTRSRDAEVARQRQMINENGIVSERLRIDTELKSLRTEIKQLARTNALNKEIFKAEEQTNKILTTEYQQGRLPYIDLITSINDYRGAEIALVNSHFRLKELLARYYFHQGSIYEKIMDRH